MVQMAVRRPQEVQAFHLAIDQDQGWRIDLQRHAPRKLGERVLPRGCGGAGTGAGDEWPVPPAEREAHIAGPGAADTAIKTLRLRDDLEPAVDVPRRFRTAEQEQAALPEREMEQRNDFRLRLLAEVDQEVAAGNEVDLREWRVDEHILHRKDDVGAQLGDTL